MKKIILWITLLLTIFSLNSFAQEPLKMQLEISEWKLKWTSDYIYFKHNITDLEWKELWFFIPWWDKKVDEEIPENEIKIIVVNHDEEKIFEKTIKNNAKIDEKIIKEKNEIKEENSLKDIQEIKTIIKEEKSGMSSWILFAVFLAIILWAWFFIIRKREED